MKTCGGDSALSTLLGDRVAAGGQRDVGSSRHLPPHRASPSSTSSTVGIRRVSHISTRRGPTDIRSATCPEEASSSPPPRFPDSMCHMGVDRRVSARRGHERGSWVFIESPDGAQHELRRPAGSLCSSFQAEMVALQTACVFLLDHSVHTEDPVIFSMARQGDDAL